MSQTDKTKTIELPMSITVRELALAIQASPIAVIKTLMANGVMANINQQIDFDTAEIVASEMGFEVILEKSEEKKEEKGAIPAWRRIISNEDRASLVRRPPVVTILGHVDHGKTTLLDAIRHTNVAGGESGGITQHIGAYQVEHDGKLITFMDTPGHAAFTAMRARGAQGADIVVLVVAADDEVMPQTREAIAHAKAAQVPIIVALNKIDRSNADIPRVKQQLAESGLVPDDWDGDTMVVPISAKEATGLDDLLEAILLVSENLEILANPNGVVVGTVIEAEIERAKGVIATLLVQNGTLRVGDIVLAGNTYGKIKAMVDYRGHKISKAGPSTPVAVMGLHGVPMAGDLFRVVANDREARQIVDEVETKMKDAIIRPVMTLEELFLRYEAGEEHELRLIIKADVQGSIEPIASSLKDLQTKDISINVLQTGTGNISDNDVMLAAASKAIILGFNVQAETAARRLADSEGVSIRLYDIIYRLIEDIEKAMKGMLEPEIKEKILGTATIREVFRISKIGNIAGCMVTEGEFRRNARGRVMRGDTALYEGEFSSLKHYQEDVREVRQGFECGVAVKGFSDYAEGDTIICYVLTKAPILT